MPVEQTFGLGPLQSPHFVCKACLAISGFTAARYRIWARNGTCKKPYNNAFSQNDSCSEYLKTYIRGRWVAGCYFASQTWLQILGVASMAIRDAERNAPQSSCLEALRSSWPEENSVEQLSRWLAGGRATVYWLQLPSFPFSCNMVTKEHRRTYCAVAA